MKIIDFIEDIKQHCSQITYLSVNHIFKKIYDDITVDDEDKENLIDILQNYQLINRYLNDYAGKIYREHSSSVETIYRELAAYLHFDTDNKYTFDSIIKKLKTQTPALLMSLADDDIKQQTISNFEEKLKALLNSNYYLNNKDKLEEELQKLQQNISLVKRASNF